MAELRQLTEKIETALSEKSRDDVFDALAGWIAFEPTLVLNDTFVTQAANRLHMHDFGTLLHGLEVPRSEATLVYCRDEMVFSHSWSSHRFVEDTRLVPWLYIPAGVAHRIEEMPPRGRLSCIGFLMHGQDDTWDFSSESDCFLPIPLFREVVGRHLAFSSWWNIVRMADKELLFC